MLTEGVEIMVIGMSTVFAFLAILVLAVNCAAGIIANYFPPPHVPTPHWPTGTTASAGAEIALVLAAAHRQRHGQGD